MYVTVCVCLCVCVLVSHTRLGADRVESQAAEHASDAKRAVDSVRPPSSADTRQDMSQRSMLHLCELAIAAAV